MTVQVMTLCERSITMINIDAKSVIETRIAESMGVDKYKKIMDWVRTTDVSSDREFQRTFNSFYRVRRNEEWRRAYYNLFEEVKNSKPSFEYIIRTMYKETGNIEASFSSKMIATVDADMPIWDRYVMQNLCMELKGKTKEDQLDCAVRLYEQMLAWYGEFLKTENGRDCITEFDKTLPGYTWMSKVKKIDFYLWSIRT